MVHRYGDTMRYINARAHYNTTRIARNVVITAYGLRILIRGHIETCKECRPTKACEKLLSLHTDLLKWDTASLPLSGNASEHYFNPQCKHDRTSYTIWSCSACAEHTESLLRNREAALTAEPAKLVDKETK